MIDIRLLVWNIALVVYILIFPIIRNFYSTRKFLSHVLRNTILTAVADGILYGLYLYAGVFKFSEFQFLLLVISGFYMYSTYPHTILVRRSEIIEGVSIDDLVMQKLSRALHGNMTDDDFSAEKIMRVRNPYQIAFTVSTVKGEESFHFEVASSLPKLFTLLHLGGLYLISMALEGTTSNPSGSEFVSIPLLGEKVSAVVAVIATIILSGIILGIELQSSRTIAVEVPLLYRRFLKKLALERLQKSEGTTEEGSNKSELERARERAREILEKRNTDVLNRKREEIRSKVDGIFNKDAPPLDDETLKRFKLMKTVERILQSTPPWTKVKLSEIAKLAGGTEEEVELIIAGLRQSGDAPGIYDIWTKTYSGSKQSQWYITELLREILKSDSTMNIDYIKILPDGTAEIGVEKQDS